jgi:hypothetical protein
LIARTRAVMAVTNPATATIEFAMACICSADTFRLHLPG